MNHKDPSVAARLKIGYLSHASNLYEELTPKENLRFFASIYRLDNGQQRVNELIEEVHLVSRQNDPVHLLSRGMVRRLAIARAIMMSPEILLLDEPFSGIDLESQKALMPILSQMEQNGCTVLMTTHDYSFLDFRDFRLLVLNDQHLVYNELCHSSEEAQTVYADILARPRDIPLQPVDTNEQLAIDMPRNEATCPNPKTQSASMGFQDYVAQIVAIFKKDLAAEIRSREMLNFMLLYALTALIIYSIAFNLVSQNAIGFVPGIVWTTLVFSGILGVSRLMDREYRHASMDVLRIAPIEPSAIFLGKLLGMFVPLLLIALLVSLSAWILFDVNIFTSGIILTLLLGLLGFSSAGTLIATLSEKTGAREILLPVLLLPLLIPLLLACTNIDVNILNGLGWYASFGWFRILLVYNLLLLAAGILTYDFVIND